MTDSTIPSNLGNRVIPLSIVIEQLRDKVSPDVLNAFLNMLNKQEPEVRPGDLITAEFMNAILSDIRALEHRVTSLEKGQITPSVPIVPTLDIELSGVKSLINGEIDILRNKITECDSPTGIGTGAIIVDARTAIIGAFGKKGCAAGKLLFTVNRIDKDSNGLPMKLESGNYEITAKVLLSKTTAGSKKSQAAFMRMRWGLAIVGNEENALTSNNTSTDQYTLSSSKDAFSFTVSLICAENVLSTGLLSIQLEKDNKTLVSKAFYVNKQPSLIIIPPDEYVFTPPIVIERPDSIEVYTLKLTSEGLLVSPTTDPDDPNTSWIRTPISQDQLKLLIDTDNNGFTHEYLKGKFSNSRALLIGNLKKQLSTNDIVLNVNR